MVAIVQWHQLRSCSRSHCNVIRRPRDATVWFSLDGDCVCDASGASSFPRALPRHTSTTTSTNRTRSTCSRLQVFFIFSRWRRRWCLWRQFVTLLLTFRAACAFAVSLKRSRSRATLACWIGDVSPKPSLSPNSTTLTSKYRPWTDLCVHWYNVGYALLASAQSQAHLKSW